MCFSFKISVYFVFDTNVNLVVFKYLMCNKNFRIKLLTMMKSGVQ